MQTARGLLFVSTTSEWFCNMTVTGIFSGQMSVCVYVCAALRSILPCHHLPPPSSVDKVKTYTHEHIQTHRCSVVGPSLSFNRQFKHVLHSVLWIMFTKKQFTEKSWVHCSHYCLVCFDNCGWKGCVGIMMRGRRGLCEQSVFTKCWLWPLDLSGRLHWQMVKLTGYMWCNEHMWNISSLHHMITYILQSGCRMVKWWCLMFFSSTSIYKQWYCLTTFIDSSKKIILQR